MRGIVRPCRHHLGPDLFARWQGHLCGLCLTLRDVLGQPARALTGYDVLLLSVLVEAQAGPVETSEAAPCPLRGFTRATVVSSDSDAGRLAAAGAVVTAAAGLSDKLHDGDLPWPAQRPARRIAASLDRSGAALAASVGLDPAAVLGAPAASAAAEAAAAPALAALLAPTGEAVASLFAHTAVVAGRPANAAALADCGRAFGRLVHLLDAVEDHAADVSAGQFNPLVATGTDAVAARALAEALVADVSRALDRVVMSDPALARVLLGEELKAAVHRALPQPVVVPVQRAPALGVLSSLMALWMSLTAAVFIGGSWGPRPRRRRRYRRYPPAGYGPAGYGPQGHGGFGYRRVGPSCGQCLCANLLCNACCCGSQCVNG